MERIEHAAAEYRNGLLCDAALDVDLGEDSYDAGMGDAITELCPRAFIAGADWRISSAWHKASPCGKGLKNGVEVLAHCEDGCHLGKFDAAGHSREDVGFVSHSGAEYALSGILEYAYLDDLLPDIEGG